MKMKTGSGGYPEYAGKTCTSGAGYRHDRIDNNADSHLKAILLGSSEALPIVKGELELGTWQSIFLPKWTGQGTGR